MGLGFGMIFAPAINTATAGVARQDSGVASALVNTMQQVGGSIGTAALSTVALTATTHYLTAHHTGPLAPVTASVHGYTVAFAVSAVLFGIGALAAVLLLPSRRRLEEPGTPRWQPARPARPVPPPRPARPSPLTRDDTGASIGGASLRPGLRRDGGRLRPPSPGVPGRPR